MGLLDLSTLIVPEQHAADNGTFDTRPKAVNAWIESLPVANLGETSRLVFKAIVELNRTTLPASQRLKTLELLNSSVIFVSNSLEKHFAGRPLPLKPKHRKVSELARALLIEMATGYKLVAISLSAEKQRLGSKELSLALHRAMHYLGLLLLRCYQVYAPCPKHVWKELHNMYSYAEHYKLSGNRFTLPEDEGLECSLSDIYKRILLLSLSLPYQLLRGEIDLVVTALCKFVSKLQIEKIAEHARPQGLFIIDMAADREPGYLSNYNGEDFSNCRLFNINELVMLLNNRELSPGLSDDLLRRLLNAWSVMPKRGFSRTNNACAPVEAAFGLSAAHYFVSGELDFNPNTSRGTKNIKLDEKSEFSSTFISNISDQKVGPDVWSSNYSYSENDPYNAPSLTQELSAEQSSQPISYSKMILGMMNTSAGGYCLSAGTSDTFSAHVGDLMAIREEHNIDIDQWGIGVIRRMKNINSSTIELGIQMLTPNAIAVAARVIGQNGSSMDSQFLRCLMLPELRAINQPATLITPNLPFKQGSRILINIQNHSYEATLTHTLQQTRSFSQFQFVMSERSIDDVTKKAKQEAPASDNDFDSVWQTL